MDGFRTHKHYRYSSGRCCATLFAVLVLLIYPPLTEARSNIEIEKVDGSKVIFKSGENLKNFQPLDTQLSKPELLGMLEREGDTAPFLLLKNSPCKGCREHPTLHLIRADGAKKATFTYPGSVRAWDTKRLLWKARAFYGNCLPGKDNIYLAFNEEKVDRRRYLQHSVLIADIEDGEIHEKLVSRRRPRLSTVLKQVKKNNCTEIKGMNRYSLKIDPPPYNRVKTD